MGKVEQLITYAVQIKDKKEREEEVKRIVSILYNMDEKLGCSYADFIKFLCEMNINMNIKVYFFMLAYCCLDNNSCQEICKDVLDHIIYVNGEEKYKEEFRHMLKNDIKLQEVYSEYFKKIDYWYILHGKYNDDDVSFVLELPKFIEIVLSDENFIEKIRRRKYFTIDKFEGFFRFLPGYFIPIYTGSPKGIKELYYYHFSDKLPEEAIEEFYNLQINIINDDNPLLFEYIDRISVLKNALKNILKDDSFYSNLETIMLKANLSFKLAINFANMYYETGFYKLLVENNSFNDEMRRKIEYLAKSNKKKDVKQLENLENITFEDLIKMKEEKNDAISSNDGGPQSRTSIHFFKKLWARGLIVVKPDGTSEEYPGPHKEGLYRAFGIEIFAGETLTQKCEEMVLRENPVTLMVLENEVNTLYLPEYPSIQAKTKIVQMFSEDANPNGSVGIFQYDSETDECQYKISNYDVVSVRDAIDIIKGLEVREYEYENDKDTVTYTQGIA